MTQVLHWRKSTYSSGGDGDTCVEVAPLPTRIALRDSKNPCGGTLSLPTGSFITFIEALKAQHPWSEPGPTR
ncbi:DUF397 domain-containing protein [Streptomyces azureus]|uniref:DUF397 domain-containing protein n=1 Tax=Streptomyces azureus TaxID=146537 RepID=A0A0K8PGT0_STRAJ|nr:DUF397 domain-containing protein [Streptomyces azureus]GAP47097.1 hypothetical protein SAZU_1834 [Streptomyces azureus]